jgi:ABC-type glycerol-3-phosphate transport system permease component
MASRSPSALSVVRDAVTAAAGLVVLLLMAFPFIWVVLVSLRPDSEVFTKTFQLFTSVTFDNYQALLANSNFPTYVRNSLMVCLTATVISVGISVLAAYGFSRHPNFRGRQVLLVLVIVTQLFPFVILITPLYTLFFKLGLINNFASLIISYVAITLPFSIYLLLGYFDSIPKELDEAAKVDGATTLGTIFRVILPVAWPGVVVVAIYAFVAAWDEFLFALTLMNSEDHKTVPVGLASFFGEYTTQWNLVMTASVISTLPTLILFMIMQRRLVSDLTAGAVKA